VAERASHLHRTLLRQLRRNGLSPASAPDAPRWERLLDVVSAAYAAADDDRYTLERSIEISSAEMRALHEELVAQARHDKLTGLPNRAALLEGLAVTVPAARRARRPLALLFVDLDAFKLVNDSLGHAAGDDVLVRAAERIRGAVRSQDLVARLGGDEFVVVCADLDDPAEAIAVAERVVLALDEPFRTNGHDALVTASVGVAVSDGDDVPEDLLRRADLAMYRAKAEGGARLVTFDAELQALAEQRMALESALRRAIEDDELVLHFQPIVSVDDGAPIALEALVRWNRPGHGLLGPGQFIPAAERCQLISTVGRWVTAQACAEAARWPDESIRVTVNLSARELAQDAVVASVASALEASGLAPGRLTLELTETTLLSTAAPIVANLGRLRALGVSIATDDFGTGYSSLSYLRSVPARLLKVDRSLTDGIERGGSEAAIMGAVITMGRALGLCVVAEGVERPEQLAALRMLGCDAAQGFLFARPMPTAQLAPWTGGRQRRAA
jgi:diguanylate cyclase (GGDEF)-like protein